MKAGLAAYLAQFALSLILAPLLPGIINRVKAICRTPRQTSATKLL